MGVVRMDNVAIVVPDMDEAIAFFEALGLTATGGAVVEGDWVDAVVGLEGTRTRIEMMRTPDGHSQLELTQYLSPNQVDAGPIAVNTVGFTRVMFAVDDIDDTVAKLAALGGMVVHEIVDYEGVYRLCYLRGPGGLVLGIAQQLDR